MSEPIYLATLGIFFGTIFMIVLIRSQTSVKKAQLQAQNEESYRAIAAQEQTAVALADLQTRVIAIEKILKEVE